jgi:hypothetical protein
LAVESVYHVCAGPARAEFFFWAVCRTTWRSFAKAAHPLGAEYVGQPLLSLLDGLADDREDIAPAVGRLHELRSTVLRSGTRST